jgi:hypothetical protein
MSTIADLFGSPLISDLRRDLLTRLNVPGFPITDEFSGAVMRTLWELEAITALDLIGENGSAQKVAMGTVPASSSGATGDWLTLLARMWFELDRIVGTFCQQTVTLACATGFGPYVLVAGRGTCTNAAGQRFSIGSGGTLSGGGTLAIQVTAEQAAAGLGLVNSIISPNLPGVTVQGSVIYDPGTGLLFGSNAESDVALLIRVLARWPDITAIDVDDRIVKWAKAASTEVTRVRLDVDPANFGGVLITVAGLAGPVSGGAVTAVQNYINDRSPITDFPTVSNAAVLNIAATAGTVTVESARLLEAQAAVDAAWLVFLSQTQIGTTVPLEKLLEIVMDQPGVIDLVFLALNGVADDVTLTATQVPVKSGTLTSQLTWNTV